MNVWEQGIPFPEEQRASPSCAGLLKAGKKEEVSRILFCRGTSRDLEVEQGPQTEPQPVPPDAGPGAPHGKTACPPEAGSRKTVPASLALLPMHAWSLARAHLPLRPSPSRVPVCHLCLHFLPGLVR